MTKRRREPVAPTATATGPRRHDRWPPKARSNGSHDYEYSALGAALERVAEGDDVFAPLIDETMLREVKFGDMVRAAMLQAEVAGR